MFDSVRLDTARVLGSGSCSTVFRGELFGQPVALKRYETTSRRDRRLLTSAAHRMLEVRHPNICSCLGPVVGDEDCAVAYELLEWPTLASQVPTMSSERSLRVVLDVARGLEYLHDNDVVHGDLQSNNVLVDPATNTAKLIDFGFSSLESSPQWRSYETRPRPDYAAAAARIAPELRRGTTTTATTATDVYGFGVLLVHVCTRDPNPERQLRGAALTAPAPEGVRALAQECLREAADQRPTASALCTRLERCIHAPKTK